MTKKRKATLHISGAVYESFVKDGVILKRDAQGNPIQWAYRGNCEYSDHIARVTYTRSQREIYQEALNAVNIVMAGQRHGDG